MWFLHWNLIELLLPVSESSPSQGTSHFSVTGKLISWRRGGLYDRGGGDAVIESETLWGHHSQIWTRRFLSADKLNAFDVYLLFNNATPLPEWFSDCCINTGTRMAIHISIAINQIFNFHRSHLQNSSCMAWGPLSLWVKCLYRFRQVLHQMFGKEAVFLSQLFLKL